MKQEHITHNSGKELVQSYIFTFARYNFDVYEKRIIYNIIYDKQIQDDVRARITEKSDNSVYTSTVSYKIKLSKITSNWGDYSRIKEAFKKLAEKGFQYEDNNIWTYLTFIAFPVIDKSTGVASFVIHKKVYDVITTIAKGYRQFDFDIVLSLKSPYSMRFYEMFSRQDKTNGGYFTMRIEELKEMFGLKNKYTLNSMFIKRVVDTAKKELDEKANYSFEYTKEKSLGSRSVDMIKFHVYHLPENERKNKTLTENRMKADISKYIRISENLYNELIDMQMPKESIHSNIYTLYIAEQMYIDKYGKHRGTLNLLVKFDELKQRSLKKGESNWIGYVIGTIKKINEIEDEKNRAEKIAYMKNIREIENQK